MDLGVIHLDGSAVCRQSPIQVSIWHALPMLLLQLVITGPRRLYTIKQTSVAKQPVCHYAPVIPTFTAVNTYVSTHCLTDRSIPPVLQKSFKISKKVEFGISKKCHCKNLIPQFSIILPICQYNSILASVLH